MKTNLRFGVLLLLIHFFSITVHAQIYNNGFEGGGIAGATSFTGGATGDPNLNIAASTWSTDGVFTTFTGNAPTAATSMALQPGTATTTTWTLGVPVNSGYAATVTGMQFDYRSTSTSYNFLTITVNGTIVYSSSISTASAWVTVSVPAFSVPGITGNISVVSVMSGGTHGGSSTFRYDNVNLYGTVAPTCTTPPTISVTPPSASICSGGSGVALTASGAGTGGTYTWLPATGLSSSAGGSVTATPTTTTIYTVTGTPTTGCPPGTASATVTVNPLPSTTITPSGPLTFCAGGSVILTAPPGTGYTYQWYNSGGGIGGATSASYTATVSDTYSVSVTSGLGCNAISTGTVVNVNPAPVVTITPTGPTTFCSGGSVSLTASGAGTGGTYSWAPATGLSATTGATVLANPTTTTTYTVTGTSGPGCLGSALVTVSVNPVPTVVVTASGPLTFCTGGSVTLTAPSGTGYTYQWYDSGGGIGGATSVSYTATASDTYSVSVTSGLGCNAISTGTAVNVNPVPVVTITPAGPTTFCSGGSVSLTASGAGTGSTYSWAPATGLSAATGATVLANPTTTTTYTVTGMSGPGCTGSASVTISVNPAPTATVTASGALTFCTGGSVTLSTSPGSGYTYQWYNGASIITGATNISYIAAASGDYSVIIANGSGCSATSGITTVTIVTTPVAVIVASGATTFCTGGSVVLNATPGAGYTYQWYNGATAIAGATTASYTATVPGVYYITITGTGGCSATTATGITVVVSPVPAASIMASGPLTICSGSGVVLTSSAGAGYTYQWYNGASPLPGATTISYTATASGNYYVIVSNSFGCSATSTTAAVVVSPYPIAAISTSGATSFCAGDSLTLNATAGAGYTYQWYNGTTLIAGATNLSYTTTTGGNYKVVVTNPAGCAGTSAITMITTIDAPIVVAVGDTIVCWGGSVFLTLNASFGAGVLYQWNINGVPIPAATGNTFPATTTGLYSCTISVPGGCVFTTAGVHVSIQPPPVPVIVYNSATYTLSTSVPYLHYQWFLYGTPIAGATSPTLISVTGDGYSVQAVDSAGCSGMSAIYDIRLAASNINGNNEIKIFPNPSGGIVNIESKENVDVVIAGVEGKIIIEQKAAKTIDVSKLPNGIYLIELFDGNGQRLTVDKLIKD